MTIRLKLTIAFLVFVLVPSIFVSVLTFTDYKNSLETIRLANVQDITVFKADRIETYFAGLKANLEVAQHYYNIKYNLPVLVRLAKSPNAPEFLSARKMLDEQLQYMQSALSLSNIMLANPSGEVVYTSNPKHNLNDFLNPLNDTHNKAFAEGKDRVYFSDIFFDKAQGNIPVMLITAPDFDFNGAFIGSIAFEVDMRSIYKLIQDATGLGDTGEVLLGKKKGNEVVYLNPLRHDPEATLKKIVSIGGKIGGPIQEAVQGRKGSGQLIDYRGKKVIAAWRYLPSLDWGMVSKIDTEEAFADVINLRKLVLIILSIVFVLCGIIAFSIAQSISAPIKALSKGAEIIGGGNLDYKIGTSLKDEIGQLSRAFNKMTLDLKKITASRDELNNEISERKMLEEERERLLNELMKSNKELEQFAYIASHDLQEPLRMVSNYVQLIGHRYKGRLDEDADEFIGYAVNGTVHMQTLINDLLAYSRVGTKGGSYKLIDLKSAFDRALINLKVEIDSSRAAITVGNLPVVYADEVQMVQVFQNLLSNAMKFSSAGVPRISVSAEMKDDEWAISIEDNGIGIDPKYFDRIFHIFKRLHTKEKYEGTGIGLAICQKIIERHGGRIWVESELGKGTSFYFTIPVKK